MNISSVYDRAACHLLGHKTEQKIIKGNDYKYRIKILGLDADHDDDQGRSYQRIVYRHDSIIEFCATCGQNHKKTTQQKDLLAEYIVLSPGILYQVRLKSLTCYESIEQQITETMICKEHGYPFVHFGEFFPNDVSDCKCIACINKNKFNNGYYKGYQETVCSKT